MNTKIIAFAALVLVLASIPLTVGLVRQRQELRIGAASATTLSISPAAVTQSIGDVFTVTVQIKTGINQVVGVQLNLSFDNLVLESLNISPGGFLDSPTELIKKIDNNTGKISYGLASFTPKEGTGVLASISFKAKAAGTSSLIFSTGTSVAASGEGEALQGTTPGSITVTSGGGTPTPTPATPPGTPTPTPTVPTTPPGCRYQCSSDSDCLSNLKCQLVGLIRRCVNPNCPDDWDCVCPAPTPTPTTPPVIRDGCILNCSVREGVAWCNVTVTTDESYMGCRYRWGGVGQYTEGGCSGLSSFNYCYWGYDGMQTIIAEVYAGREGGGPIIANCTSNVTTDCSGLPNQSPICSSINGPSQVLPNSETSFTADASDPDGPETGFIYMWSVSCGKIVGAVGGQRVDTIAWKAPATPTSCTISANVEDVRGAEANCPAKTVQVTGDAPTPTPTPGGPTPTPTPTPPAGVQAMIISNYQDFRGGIEEPFASVKSWTLTEGDGLKTVWAKFKVGGVWTTPVSDSITLDKGAQPTPTPTPPPGGYLKLDLLRVWFKQQDKSLGRGHEGGVLLILKQGGNVVLEKAVQLDENGEARGVELPGVGAGTYDAFIYEPGYLTKKLAGVSITETGSTLDFTRGGSDYLLPGDFNGDQVVNVLDFSIFVKSYDKEGER